MIEPVTRKGPDAGTTVRLVQSSLGIGIVLFAGVAHFLIKQKGPIAPDMESIVINVLLGVSVAACVLGVVLRQRIPRRVREESADLYWSNSQHRLLIASAPFEFAGLISIVVYMLVASPIALGVAAIGVLGLLSLYPGLFDRT